MAQKKLAKSKPAKIYLGLGSNLGKRRYNLSTAVDLLSDQVNVERLSSLYETKPVGYLDQPQFINAVLRGTTSLSPQELLAKAKEIEKILGREPSFKDAPRQIDIDILFYDKLILESPDLTIPHPRLEERAFVLVPLAEIAPNLVHPVSKKKISEMLKNVEGREGVIKWKQEVKDV